MQWFSHSIAPFSFENSHGPTGITVDVLAAALARAELAKATPTFMPLARIVGLLNGSTPACLTTYARTSEREARMQWVGPVLSSDIVVARRTPAPPWPTDGKRLSGSKVAVLRGSVGAKAALDLGAAPDAVTSVNTPENAARMLMAGRVDAWVHSEAVIRWTFNAMNTPRASYTIDGRVNVGDIYFACSLAVDSNYIARLQKGLLALKAPDQDGLSEVDRILARHLESIPR